MISPFVAYYMLRNKIFKKTFEGECCTANEGGTKSCTDTWYETQVHYTSRVDIERSSSLLVRLGLAGLLAGCSRHLSHRRQRILSDLPHHSGCLLYRTFVRLNLQDSMFPELFSVARAYASWRMAFCVVFALPLCLLYVYCSVNSFIGHLFWVPYFL